MFETDRKIDLILTEALHRLKPNTLFLLRELTKRSNLKMVRKRVGEYPCVKLDGQEGRGNLYVYRPTPETCESCQVREDGNCYSHTPEVIT